MKIEITIDSQDLVEEYYDYYGDAANTDHGKQFFELIVDRIADNIMMEKFSHAERIKWAEVIDQKIKSIEDRFEYQYKLKLERAIDSKTFKQSVLDEVKKSFSEKYEKTKFEKELESELGIEAESKNKRYLKEIIRETVREEIKKVFK